MRSKQARADPGPCQVNARYRPMNSRAFTRCGAFPAGRRCLWLPIRPIDRQTSFLIRCLGLMRLDVVRSVLQLSHFAHCDTPLPYVPSSFVKLCRRKLTCSSLPGVQDSVSDLTRYLQKPKLVLLRQAAAPVTCTDPRPPALPCQERPPRHRHHSIYNWSLYVSFPQ